MDAENPVTSGQASFEAIERDAWQRLQAGVQLSKHPYHLGTFGTINSKPPQGNLPIADLRTVVLRVAEPDSKTLMFHTDWRSDKIKQLQTNPSGCWVFYDAQDKIQLRLEGATSVHFDDPIAAERWSKVEAYSRRCYGVTPKPGTLLPEPGSGIPEPYIRAAPPLEKTEDWYSHFAVVKTVVQRMDWLFLRSAGHQRAQFIYSQDGSFKSSWAIP